jgi:aminotransferase
MSLLAMTGVASVPGEAFYHGHNGKSLVRFCFAKTNADLEEACNRVKQLPSMAESQFASAPKF